MFHWGAGFSLCRRHRDQVYCDRDLPNDLDSDMDLKNRRQHDARRTRANTNSCDTGTIVRLCRDFAINVYPSGFPATSGFTI